MWETLERASKEKASKGGNWVSPGNKRASGGGGGHQQKSGRRIKKGEAYETGAGFDTGRSAGEIFKKRRRGGTRDRIL